MNSIDEKSEQHFCIKCKQGLYLLIDFPLLFLGKYYIEYDAAMANRKWKHKHMFEKATF